MVFMNDKMLKKAIFVVPFKNKTVYIRKRSIAISV